MRQRWLPTREGYIAQLQAILAWEGYSRIDQIKAPTLVIHGKSDALVPPGQWRVDRRPDSRRKTRPARSRQSLVSDRPGEAGKREILEFLSLSESNLKQRSETGTSATEVRGNAPISMDIPGRHTSSSK
jgi:hypothetical protein